MQKLSIVILNQEILCNKNIFLYFFYKLYANKKNKNHRLKVINHRLKIRNHKLKIKNYRMKIGQIGLPKIIKKKIKNFKKRFEITKTVFMFGTTKYRGICYYKFVIKINFSIPLVQRKMHKLNLYYYIFYNYTLYLFII